MAFNIDMRKYRFQKPVTAQELSSAISSSSALIKLACGVSNCMAYLLMCDARDIIRKHPRYNGKIKLLYNRAFDEYNAYLRNLRNPPSDKPRFFHIADMGESTRKHFGDITDEQYFEFWEGCGGRSYVTLRPLITSLANKYRLAITRHGINHAEILQWVMTTEAMLEISVQMWETCTQELADRHSLPLTLIRKVFSCFSLQRVAAAWKKALDATAPSTMTLQLEEYEERNIELGLIQLTEALSEPEELYSSLLGSVEDYEEVFRTKGEQKKMIRQIKELGKECSR